MTTVTADVGAAVESLAAVLVPGFFDYLATGLAAGDYLATGDGSWLDAGLNPQSGLTPIELLSGQRLDAPGEVEEGADVAAGRSLPLAAGGSVAADPDVPDEAVAKSGADFAAATENAGLPPLIIPAVGWLEWSAELVPATAIGPQPEWYASALTGGSPSVESLAAAPADETLPAEVSHGVGADGTMPAETLLVACRSGGDLGWLILVAGGRETAAELAASVGSQPANPAEWEALAAGDGAIIAEWQRVPPLDPVAGTCGPVEWSVTPSVPLFLVRRGRLRAAPPVDRIRPED